MLVKLMLGGDAEHNDGQVSQDTAVVGGGGETGGPRWWRQQRGALLVDDHRWRRFRRRRSGWSRFVAVNTIYVRQPRRQLQTQLLLDWLLLLPRPPRRSASSLAVEVCVDTTLTLTFFHLRNVPEK